MKTKRHVPGRHELNLIHSSSMVKWTHNSITNYALLRIILLEKMHCSSHVFSHSPSPFLPLNMSVFSCPSASLALAIKPLKVDAGFPTKAVLMIANVMSPPIHFALFGTNRNRGPISGSFSSLSATDKSCPSEMSTIGCSNIPRGRNIALTYSGSISKAATGSHPDFEDILSSCCMPLFRSSGRELKDRLWMTEYTCDLLPLPNNSSREMHISLTFLFSEFTPSPLL
mmetsp:Transcript_28789/g.45343  ORF Transcript_28789/g.45343 Transcript_28789/m.45343 type:complete len:227 (+) Transcript_28789:2287-2967(+)